MTLSVKWNYEWLYADSVEEASDLASRVLHEIKSERLVGGRYLVPGEIATFICADHRYTGSMPLPASMLLVAANNSTGYGALIWCSMDGPLAAGSNWDVWISDNPRPPSFDPRVVADPDKDAFHDRKSVIAISELRKVVEEFCRTDTGSRPESIDWVRGGLDGVRNRV